MNKITIRIEANEGAEFVEVAQYAIAEALRRIATKLEEDGLEYLPDLGLYDYSGNKIGKITIA